jgi:HEAT repeat protein
MFRSESFDLITRMLPREENASVLGSQIAALGHFANVAAVPFIVPYASHPDENVRFQVAFALGCYHDEPASIEVLQKLMDDEDRDVRDWAIFGLGVQGNADSEEIRLSFLRHLSDPFLDARIDAAAALGKRRDERLAKPLIEMLKNNGNLNGLVEAARELLALDDDPHWTKEEYIVAIERQFPQTQK